MTTSLTLSSPQKPEIIKTHDRMSARTWFRTLAWRHVVAIVAISFALFPVIWMASAAFDQSGSFGTQQLIPPNAGFGNFRKLLNNPDQPYLIWMRNSVVISSINALFCVAIGTFAAYALSRFRYKGRKATLLSILVIQMFPQLLAITAIFLILVQLGQSIPFMSIGHLSALIIVFAGGALGINAWMLKGFFDTIPQELDESAKIDGATHAQTFFQIILPLVRPILAVTFLLSFIGTMNEYILTQVIIGGKQSTLTLAVGMQQYISNQYTKNWGPFAAGALIASLPVMALFMFLQKYVITGLTAGSTKG
ncbi:MAG: sugar ABC transporter permease [Actinomycetes bacterium]|jgi:arabinogalactan oligomer/maltooligosaccharide transport system permease protein